MTPCHSPTHAISNLTAILQGMLIPSVLDLRKQVGASPAIALVWQADPSLKRETSGYITQQFSKLESANQGSPRFSLRFPLRTCPSLHLPVSDQSPTLTGSTPLVPYPHSTNKSCVSRHRSGSQPSPVFTSGLFLPSHHHIHSPQNCRKSLLAATGAPTHLLPLPLPPARWILLQLSCDHT